MLRVYDPNVKPPETYELVSALAERLAALLPATGLLVGGGGVERYRWGAPPAAVSEPWTRVLVREPYNPYVTTSSTLHLWAPVEIAVQSSDAGAGGWNPWASCSALHLAIYINLTGYRPALEYADPIGLVERQGNPARAVLSAEVDAFESVAVYRIALGPTNQ